MYPPPHMTGMGRQAASEMLSCDAQQGEHGRAQQQQQQGHAEQQQQQGRGDHGPPRTEAHERWR